MKALEAELNVAAELFGIEDPYVLPKPEPFPWTLAIYILLGVLVLFICVCAACAAGAFAGTKKKNEVNQEWHGAASSEQDSGSTSKPNAEDTHPAVEAA